LDKFDDFRTSLHWRDRPLVAFGSVMFDLGGIGIVVFDPYPASHSIKPVTFFPYLLGGVGVKWWNSLLSPHPDDLFFSHPL
jgi:hypothetical protein